MDNTSTISLLPQDHPLILHSLIDQPDKVPASRLCLLQKAGGKDTVSLSSASTAPSNLNLPSSLSQRRSNIIATDGSGY
jgi:hypothetical protein